MTYEAEMAKRVSYKFEAKKDALRQTQDGGVKVTLSVHPQEMPQELYGDAMGQRYMCVIVPLNDDETPKAPQGKNYTAAAKMLAKNESFQKYVAYDKGQQSCYGDGEAEQWIEYTCGVTSCKDIKDGTDAGRKFAQLSAQFQEWESR